MKKTEAIIEAVRWFDATSGVSQVVVRRGDQYDVGERRGWRTAEIIGPGNVHNYRSAEWTSTDGKREFKNGEWKDAEGFVKGDYSQTYWNHKGKHEELASKLHYLVEQFAGSTGPVFEHPALELYRKAANCYYDLYNNGGGNTIQQFREVFGFDGPCTEHTSEYSLNASNIYDEWWTQANIDRVEIAMNGIIDAAAQEQHLGPYAPKTEPVFIDLTPQSLKTPEGAKRVKQAQDDFDEAREAVARVATSIRTTLYAIRSACNDKSLRSRLREYFCPDDLIELIEAIEARMKAEEAFIRSVAGR